MQVVKFEDKWAKDWDDFVLNQSINGNFLQTRRFLSYHGTQKFEDSSLLLQDSKQHIVAVIPAARKDRVFISHPGSTYGGIVICKKSAKSRVLQAIIESLNSYSYGEGLREIDLRFQPDFMWKEDHSALIEYLLKLDGFSEKIELTTYVDLANYKDDILANFTQGKRTNVNNCIKAGLEIKQISSMKEIEQFYCLLEANLEKFKAKPVHTPEELNLLNNNLVKDESVMLGCFMGDKMVAGGWLFLFSNQCTLHTQYLCADATYSSLSPMTYMYYYALRYAKEKGYRYVSWGISTEEQGKTLNWGLTNSKESFGSLHGVHRSFSKSLGR